MLACVLSRAEPSRADVVLAVGVIIVSLEHQHRYSLHKQQLTLTTQKRKTLYMESFPASCDSYITVVRHILVEEATSFSFSSSFSLLALVSSFFVEVTSCSGLNVCLKMD